MKFLISEVPSYTNDSGQRPRYFPMTVCTLSCQWGKGALASLRTMFLTVRLSPRAADSPAPKHSAPSPRVSSISPENVSSYKKTILRRWSCRRCRLGRRPRGARRRCRNGRSGVPHPCSMTRSRCSRCPKPCRDGRCRPW